MKGLFDKLTLNCLKAKMSMQEKVKKLVDDERGDTNFISIAIILIVIIVIAILFITFSNDIKAKFGAAVKNLFAALP